MIRMWMIFQKKCFFNKKLKYTKQELQKKKVMWSP